MIQKTEAQAERFATTHWSVIAEAKEHAIPGSEAALERLCRIYWYPLYSFVRREGYDDESAKDLTQGFFARFLEKNYLGQTQRERGKFRSFLLASLKHFLSDERDKVRAQKRGGGKTFVSFSPSEIFSPAWFGHESAMADDRVILACRLDIRFLIVLGNLDTITEWRSDISH